MNPSISASNTILYCTDWAKAVVFYRDLLELPVSFEKDGWFMELVLNESAHLSLAAAAHCTIEAGHGVGITLSWCVPELETLREMLVENGVKVTDIISHSWRAPYFYAWDPEGNRIEFWVNVQP